jgi:hypothetical protein
MARVTGGNPVNSDVMPQPLIARGELTMRIAVAVCFTFLFFTTAFAQNKFKEQDEDIYSIRLVKEAVKNPALALSFSATVKQIQWLGDRVAIALLKIYDPAELKDVGNIRNYLLIIREAFMAPRIIRLAEDREPRVTTFLLASLVREVTDENLRADITQTIKYINIQTAKE